MTEMSSSLAESSREAANSSKVCAICGDKAIGFNFNVRSCESCKAFFRRHATREIAFSCPFSNTCDISPLSRRFCQRCRLQKCFDVGMKKDSIEAENKQQKRKSAKRKGKMRDRFDDKAGEMEPDMDMDMRRGGGLVEMMGLMDRAIGRLVSMEGSRSADDIQIPRKLLLDLLNSRISPGLSNGALQCRCRCTCGFYSLNTQLTAAVPTSAEFIGFPIGQSTKQQQQQMPKTDEMTAYSHGSSSMTCNEWLSNAPDRSAAPFLDVMSATIHSEFSHSPVIEHNPSGDCCQIATADSSTYQHQQEEVEEEQGLNDEERGRLEELVAADVVMKEPLCMDIRRGDLGLLDLIRLMDMAIRRLINMSKRLAPFRRLCQQDQIALLKGSCSEMLILRGVMAYDANRDVWNHPDTQGAAEIQLDVLKRAKGGSHYEEHKRFLKTFSPKWRSNEQVILILSAITLFSPDRPNLKYSEVVRKEQENYYILLRSYLDRECTESESRQAYDHLLRKLIDLHQLNQGILRLIGEMNPKELDPLLLELFDLK